MSDYLRRQGTRAVVEIPAGTATTMQVLISAEEGPHFAMRKFTMAPHGGMPLHTNTVEHEQYIVSGSAAVTIGEEIFTVTAGDSVYIPANMPHSYQAGADGFAFICVVPNQEDKITLV